MDIPNRPSEKYFQSQKKIQRSASGLFEF